MPPWSSILSAQLATFIVYTCMKQHYLHLFIFTLPHSVLTCVIRCWICVFLSGAFFTSSAQLCAGNLGSPIINYTFGAGSSQPLPPGSTSYTYSHGCPSPGNYSIEHFLFGCAGNTWVTLTGDHTHDPNGNYMLVNGATAPANVLVDTVTGLCSNTTYQFSAWLANCMQSNACNNNPVLPNFTFSIETLSGTVLASSVTPDLPVTGFKDWVEYGVCYTTPSTTPGTVVLRIKCNTGGPCGSSFVMDDVTFGAAGPPINVTVNGANTPVLDLCMGYTNTYILNGTYSGFTDPVLQWQRSLDTGRVWSDIPGATTATYIMPQRNDSVILYRLSIAERTNAGNANCTIHSAKIWTNVHPLPDHTSLQQVLGCLNKDLTLSAPEYFLAYQWAGPNGFQSNLRQPVINNLQYAGAGIYTVLLTADFGCSVTDSFQLNIFPGTTISTNTLYNICEGTSVNLSATGDGTYEWTPSIGLSNAFIANPVASPRDSIEYKVVLTNIYGCKDSVQVVINVYKKVVVDAGPDKLILTGDTALLTGSVAGTAVNYFWSPDNTLSNVTVLQPTVFPLAQATYTLHGVSTVGCGNESDDVTVRVYNDVLMPNAFTPNKDGINDVFHVLALDNYELSSFNIYTRWGQKIFSTTNATIGWDGTAKGQPQATGLYVYYLEMKSKAGKKITRKGTVLLIR